MSRLSFWVHRHAAMCNLPNRLLSSNAKERLEWYNYSWSMTARVASAAKWRRSRFMLAQSARSTIRPRSPQFVLLCIFAQKFEHIFWTESYIVLCVLSGKNRKICNNVIIFRSVPTTSFHISGQVKKNVCGATSASSCTVDCWFYPRDCKLY